MYRLSKGTLLLVSIAVSAFLLQSCMCQQDFTVADIPDPFRVGDFYPPRPEVEVCRPIRDYINRGSARFNNELVTNTNPLINYGDQNSRIMTSRMQSRLNSLARLFYNRFDRKIRVVKAWTPFPDPDLANDDLSLHYEGRSVCVQVDRSEHYNDLSELAVRAAFDWVYYASSNLVQLSVIPNDCDRNVDCVFMLDQSGSVGRDNHDTAITFVRNVVSFFNIGLDASRFGFVAYSTRSHLEFDLDDRTTLSSLDRAIRRINYRGGWTATALALNTTRIILNPRRNFGARSNSEGIPKIGILITDGKSNQYPITYAAPALKNSGVQVYTVGIGNIDRNELRFIASDPDNEHVFILSSYDDAPAFVDFLSVLTCETPAIINTCEETITMVSDGSFRYFQIQCSAFASTVKVELEDIEGTTFLFCSSEESNPGPLTEDTNSDTTQGVTSRSCTLTLIENDQVIYAGIQGQADRNVFSLFVYNTLFNQETISIEVLDGTTDSDVHDLKQNLVSEATGVLYQYEIISGNDQDIFSINNQGYLQVRNSGVLDFNQQSIHRLEIQATNSNEACQCSKVLVEINVVSRDINFNALPDQQIPENADLGTEIVTVVAGGGSSEVQYSITGGNTNNAFRIGGTSGVIQLNNNLDFETIMDYTLTITAETIRLGIAISGEVTQRITVLDVNEAPQFETPCANMATGCSFSLNENENAGHLVGNIVASDPDLSSSPNGMLSYRFMPIGLPFAVNSNGQITTTESLDREERESYSLTLVVSDGCAGCSLSIQTTVLITINDVNDNAPLFIEAPTNIQVMENAPQGFDVAQYIAEDSDEGTNAEIEYSLTANSPVPFALDSQTGLLTVDGNIDYESVQMYTVSVTASNPGNTQSTSVTVQIEVINLNDNTPQFSQSSYSSSVEEHSSVGTMITTVSATDNDLGSHGIVRYSIIDGNILNLLTINNTNGEIIVAGDIDREQITLISLIVQARDMGSPQRRQARVSVNVIVTDINDNAPVFNPDSHSLHLREDIQPIFNVVRLFASDRDEPGNPNSMIIYSIQSGNDDGKFMLDSSNGQLQLVQSLDFEVQNFYQLQILATDQGTPSMSDTATVTITVTNVNENPPTLSGDQSVEVSELAPVGTNVARFEALDPDNMPVTFRINSGNEEAKFMINETTGVISLIALLDYEITTEYILGITASDGSRQAMISLTVTVIDENEFTPQFVGGTSFEINEEQTTGTLVGTLLATDGDAGQNNSRITYSFVQQSQFTNLFNLNSISGQITTNDILNRETLTQIFPPLNSQHSIEVSARDGGSPSLQSITTITVTLRDINDNAPQFSDTSYTNSLLENLPPDQRVFQLEATDIDLGSNAQIQYSFTLTNNVDASIPFSINSSSGIIQTTETLDCELQPSYEFTLTATDMGNPSMSSQVQGTLLLIDENDNDPIFTMEIYRVTVNETVQIGDTLLKVTANDRDKGSNGQVVYSVINPRNSLNTIENQEEEFTIFAIDFSSGDVRHTTPFDYEINDHVNVTVVAHDMGVPRRSGSALVVFTVLNVDESPPRFVGSCDASIDEEVSIGTMVTQCIAVDLDNVTTSNNQNAITYQILNGNTGNKFEIEEHTGIIRTAGRLDAEERTFYTLTVSAIDLVGRRSFSQSVDISIRDINDNAPQFTSPSYEFKLSDSAIINYQQEIIIVEASDADSGSNGMFTYSIGEINPRVGEMETTVEIVATDQGYSTMSSSVLLTVTFDSQCLLQDYAITQTSSSRGTVSVYVLCHVKLRPSGLEVPLRSSDTFYCNILRNSQTSYQWLHNGTAITSSENLGQGRSEASYTIQNAQYENAGEYACKATTRVGSLQTAGGVVNIQVPPVIIIPPQDIAVTKGSEATFTCSASGTPAPDIEWLIDGEIVATGSPLVIDDIDKENERIYTCRARSAAGEETASVRLTVYESTDVVEIVLETVSNPNEDSTCHIVNTDEFENVLSSITSQTIMVTAIQGVGICEQTACTPNPCKNGGKCELTDQVIGGYTCNCIEGYTGRNCSADVDECLDDPCGVNGACVNQQGSYECMCSAGISGHRCQYTDVCETSTPCDNEQICLQMISADGYICKEMPNPSTSLVIGGINGDPGFLNDLLQTFIEQQLASTSKRRRRRQDGSTLGTQCEPRFSQLDPSDNAYVLIWICPPGEPEPNAEDMALVCDFLLQQFAVDTCKPPNGTVMEQPTAQPLPDTNVKLEIILVDTNTNLPIDGLESTKILEETQAKNELANGTGLTVSAITAQVTGPRTQPPSNINNGGNSGAVAGGVIGGLLALLILVAGGVVLVVVGSMKYKDHKKRQRDKQKYALKMASVQSNISLAERGAALERKSSVDQLIDNEYDSLPPRENVSEQSKPSNISTAEQGAVLERQSSVDQLIDNDNDYDSLPPRENINIYSDISPESIIENAYTEEEQTV